MMLFEILVPIVFLLIYYYLYKPLQFWKNRGVKCAKNPLPIVGNSLDFFLRKKSFVDILVELYNEYPTDRYNGFFLTARPVLLVRDLDLIKQICIKDFDHFTDHYIFIDEDVDPIMGKNLFVLRGHRWKEMRNTLSPAFTSSKMRGMFLFMSECAQSTVDFYLEKKEPLVIMEMKDLFTRFMNDVIASAAFGVRCDSLREPNNVFYLNGKRATTLTGIQNLKNIIVQVYPELMKRTGLRLFPGSVEEFFRSTVKNNIEQREKKGIVRPDLIHLLMEARKGKLKHETIKDESAGFATVDESNEGKQESYQKRELTDDDIVSQALLFYFAGFDAASTLSSFMAHELATHPDIQRKLQEEIDRVRNENLGKPTYDTIMGMKYLDMVISEVLRLWSPGFMLDRICVKDYTIEPVTPDEKPLQLVKGDQIVIPVCGIHRDSKYYPDPLKFDPERFSDKNKDNIVPGTYMPFGIGPRNCIGSRFALLETKAVFFHLLASFDIVTVEKTPIPLKISAKTFNITVDKGAWLGLKPRNSDENYTKIKLN